MEASRFPGKPLHLLAGKPMILWTAEAAARAELVDRVVVATDSEAIVAVCNDAGVEVVVTGPAASGTDRIAQALAGIETDLVVNVQGDEPLIAPSTIDAMIRPFRSWDQQPMVVTAATRCASLADFLSPHNVKVTVARDGSACYFSRAPIPWGDNPAAQVQAGLIHKGIYAYWKELVVRFAGWDAAKLETMERLEQLRFLDRGIDVTIIVVEDPCFGIDTPEEAQAAEQILMKRV